MADSPHEAILDAWAARAGTLGLDGVQERVYRREVFDTLDETWAVNVTLPGIVYGPPGTLEPLPELTDSARDGWGYPVVMRIVDRHDAAQDPVGVGPHLKWQWIVRSAFHNKTLAVDFPDVQVVKGRCLGGVVVEEFMRRAQLLALGLVSLSLVFSFRAVELRG
jgi:hypothetical protein